MSIFSDDTVKKLYFTDMTAGTDITDKVIYGSLSGENYLSADDLNFGECNSERIQFETSENLSLTGHQIKIEYGTDSEKATVGVFKINYISTQINSDVCKITAYDCVKEFDKDVVSWYENLTLPMSVSALRNSLCAYVGVDQEALSLTNDNLMIDETIAPQEMDGRSVLRWLGQITNTFPHSTKDYKLTWISLSSTEQTIPSDVLIGANAYKGKGYTTADIGGVVILAEEGDVGGSAGAKSNRYEILGNPFLFGRTDLNDIAESIFNRVKNVKYVPSEIDIKFIPEYTLGSLLKCNGNKFYNLGYKYNGAMECTIVADGNRYRDDSGSVDSDVLILKGKSNVLKRDIESLSNTITDVEAGWNSKLEQTSTDIKAEISTIQQELDGENVVYYTDGEPTLNSYPAYDWSKSIPTNSTIQLGDGVGWEYTDEWYREHARAMAFDETNAISYRFKTTGGKWGWVAIADSDFSLLFSRVVSLEMSTEGIEERVHTVETTHYTKTETDSAIKVAADNINLSVKQTYQSKDAANEANQLIEDKISEINIDLDKISISVSSATSKAETAYKAVSSLDVRTTSIEASVSSQQRSLNETISSVANLSVTSTEIKGEVSKKANKEEGSTSSSFSYSLTASQFVLRNNSTEVFKCNKDGVTITGNATVTGTIRAKSGYIGSGTTAGFTIDSDRIYNGKTAMTSTDTGVLISRYGIACGNTADDTTRGFRVTNSGTLYAYSAHISGEITATSGLIAGLTIADSSIYVGKKTLTDSNDGVRITPTGIALGKSKAFHVTDAGVLTAKAGEIGGCKINNGVLEIKNANIAETIKATKISADIARVTDLDAVSARVGTLEADHVSTTSFNSLNATVKNKLTTTELDSKISALTYLHVGSILYFQNTAANATIMQVPKGDGSGTMVNVTAKELLKALGKA